VNDRPPLQALPFGLLELDEKVIVTGFSPVNECSSQVRAEDIIGRDFFEEIVPFAEAKETEEKFRRFMMRSDSHERLFFTFGSEQGDISVQIALAYLPEKEPTRLAIARLMPESKEGQPE
jgi:hypothetical protein